MIAKTFNGCKIKVRAFRDRDRWGTLLATVNGEPYSVAERFDEAKAVAKIEQELALIHAQPIDGDRWPAHCYTPGTYEMCNEGLHPREIGGECTHATCQPGWGEAR